MRVPNFFTSSCQARLGCAVIGTDCIAAPVTRSMAALGRAQKLMPISVNSEARTRNINRVPINMHQTSIETIFLITA